MRKSSKTRRREDVPLAELIGRHRYSTHGLKQVDTKTTVFYDVMSCVIQLQMVRLAKQLDYREIDIHGGTFQDFLRALGRLPAPRVHTPSAKKTPRFRAG